MARIRSSSSPNLDLVQHPTGPGDVRSTRIRSADASAVTRNLPYPSHVSPNAFGAQAGAALEGVGGSLTGMAGKLEALQNQKAAVDADLSYSNATGQLTRDYIEQKSAAEEGMPGFTDGWLKYYDDYTKKVLDGTPNHQAHQKLRAGFAKLRNTFVVKAAGDEATSTAHARTRAVNSALDGSLNTIMADPSMYDTALEAGYKLIDDLDAGATVRGTESGGDARAELKQDFLRNATKARFSTMLDVAGSPEDVAEIKKELVKDEWRQKLDPNSYNELNKKVLSREKDIVTQGKADVNGAIERVDAKMKAGLPIPEGDLRQIDDMVATKGDEAIAEKWITKRIEFTTYRDGARNRPSTNRENLRQLQAPPADQSPAGGGSRSSAAVNFFVQRGYTPAQAAGIVGNLRAESGHDLRTSARNPGDGADGSDSIGVAQWNAERARALKQFAQKNGKDWQDFDTQLAFIDHELNTSERATKDRLTRAGTPEQAAEAFVGYERPRGWSVNNPRGAHGWKNRAAQANKVFGEAGGGTRSAQASDTIRAAQANATKRVIDDQDKARNSGGQMDWAVKSGIIKQVVPLTDDQQSYIDRGAQSRMAADYLDAEPRPFTEQEASDLTRRLDDSGTSIDERMQIITNIGAMGDMAEPALKQLGKVNGVHEHIGGMAARGPEQAVVARETLIGRDRLRDNASLKGGLFAGANTNREFFNAIGSSLDRVSGRTQNAIKESADALYASRMGGAGTDAFDPDVYRKAVGDVIGAGEHGGGVGEINGHKTVLPAGVSEDAFDSALDALTPDDLTALSLSGPPVYRDGQPATPAEISEEGRFEVVDADHYAIVMADGLPILTPAGDHYVIKLDAVAVKDLLARTVSPPTASPQTRNPFSPFMGTP